MNIAKRQIKTQETKDIVVDKTHQVVRDFVAQNSPFYDPDVLIENLRKEIVTIKTKETGIPQKFMADFQKAGMTLGLFTHIPVAETVKEEYRTFLVEMIRSIEREYDCKTATEKALAETIASSHIKAIQFSKELTLYTQNKDLSHEKNGYCSMLGKEIDRAYRNFTTALITLKQLKSPPLEINIKAKTAFVAHNQQFNNNQNKNND